VFYPPAPHGHVEVDIADAIDGQVTVFTSNAEWDVVLAAVLDATGLSYRYDPLRKRLQIASIAELSAGRPVGPPYAFLDVYTRARHGDTLVIDGKVTEVPPGLQVPVRAGRRFVEIRTRGGGKLEYTVELAPGAHMPLPAPPADGGDPDPRPGRAGK
jgi:hypothetical protein